MGHNHLAHPHWVQDPFSSPSFTQQGKPLTPMLGACCSVTPALSPPWHSHLPLRGFCSEQPVFFLHSPQHCSTPRNTNCSWLPLLISLGPVTAFDLTPVSTTLLPFPAPSPFCSIRKPSLTASQKDFSINPIYCASLHLPLVNLPSALCPQTLISGKCGADSCEASTCEGLVQRQAWDCACRDGHACPGIHVFLPAHANTYMLLPTFPLPDPRLWDFKGSSCSPMGHGHNLHSTAAGWDSGCLVLQSLD